MNTGTEAHGGGASGWFRKELSLGNLLLIAGLVWAAASFHQRSVSTEETMKALRAEVTGSASIARDAQEQNRLLAYQVGSLSEQLKRLTDELKDIRRDVTGRFR
jgi:hypothetical protein